MKIFLIYLIGLVFFMTLPYLVLKESERPKYYEIISLLWGFLWPFFLIFWLVQTGVRRIVSNRLRRRGVGRWK